MRDLLYMLRFFRVVAPIPPLMAPAMVITGTVAAVLAIAGIAGPREALTPLLLLQVFAASSGFMVPARRGHYDLLLTAGYGRVPIAVTHWVVSVLPGIGVWAAVAVVDAAAAGGSAGLSGAGTAVAIALASTVPWAATVAWPRFTGAIAWLLVLTTAVAGLPADLSPIVVDPLQEPSWWVAAGAAALYPVTLVGSQVAAPDAPRVLPALALAGLCMAAALAWISRQDIALEAPQ